MEGSVHRRLAVVVATVMFVCAAVPCWPQEAITKKKVPGTRLTVLPLKNPIPPARSVAALDTSHWNAARNLYFRYLEDHELDSEGSKFWSALRSVFDARLEDATSAFESLAAESGDETIQERSRELLAILYQNDGQNEKLLDLVRRHPEMEEQGAVDPGDLALMRASELESLPRQSLNLPDAPFELPLTFSFAGTPMVLVTLNEEYEVEFWLDTGASGTVIASNVAEKAQVRLVTPTVEVENLGNALPIRGGLLEQLDLGPLKVSNVSVAVIDSAVLSIAGHQIAGIIGWPILRELRLRFDGAGGTLTIERSRAMENRERNFFWLDYPFVRLWSPAGVPLNFGLDTGADVTRIKTNLFTKLIGLHPVDVHTRSAALGHLSSAQGLMLEEVEFLVSTARLSFRNVKTADVVQARFVEADGRLGADVLRKAVVLMDYAAGVFEVTPRVEDQ